MSLENNLGRVLSIIWFVHQPPKEHDLLWQSGEASEVNYVASGAEKRGASGEVSWSALAVEEALGHRM